MARWRRTYKVNSFLGCVVLAVLAVQVPDINAAFNDCESSCWQGTLYFTYTGYCDHFRVTQSAPSIHCPVSTGRCYEGSGRMKVDPVNTLTRQVGDCVTNCQSGIPTGVPREGTNFSSPYMTFEEDRFVCTGEMKSPDMG